MEELLDAVKLSFFSAHCLVLVASLFSESGFVILACARAPVLVLQFFVLQIIDVCCFFALFIFVRLELMRMVVVF